MKRTVALAFTCLIFSLSAFAKRIDTKVESSTSEIATALRQAAAVSISCGDDVDPDTCKYFMNSLASALADRKIKVYLFFNPEVLVQSFYVPPRLGVPSTVTLRLIEDRLSPRVANLYVSGTCFTLPLNADLSGYHLPEFVQTETGHDYGPLDADKAEAASRLAKEFAAYWRQTTSQSQTSAESFQSRYGWYVNIIKRTVAQNWYSQLADPNASMGHSVVVGFTICRDGSFDNVHIVRPSGVPSLDLSAIQAVNRIKAFDPLPVTYDGKSAAVQYTFTYNARTRGQASPP